MSLLSKSKKKDGSKSKEKTVGKTTKSGERNRSKSRPKTTNKGKNIKGIMDKITFKIKKPQFEGSAENKPKGDDLAGETMEVMKEPGETSEPVLPKTSNEAGANAPQAKDVEKANDTKNEPPEDSNDLTNEQREDGAKFEDLLSGNNLDQYVTEQSTTNIEVPGSSSDNIESTDDEVCIAQALLGYVEDRVGLGKYVEIDSEANIPADTDIPGDTDIDSEASIPADADTVDQNPVTEHMELTSN